MSFWVFVPDELFKLQIFVFCHMQGIDNALLVFNFQVVFVVGARSAFGRRAGRSGAETEERGAAKWRGRGRGRRNTHLNIICGVCQICSPLVDLFSKASTKEQVDRKQG